MIFCHCFTFIPGEKSSVVPTNAWDKDSKKPRFFLFLRRNSGNHGKSRQNDDDSAREVRADDDPAGRKTGHGACRPFDREHAYLRYLQPCRYVLYRTNQYTVGGGSRHRFLLHGADTVGRDFLRTGFRELYFPCAWPPGCRRCRANGSRGACFFDSDRTGACCCKFHRDASSAFSSRLDGDHHALRSRLLQLHTARYSVHYGHFYAQQPDASPGKCLPFDGRDRVGCGAQHSSRSDPDFRLRIGNTRCRTCNGNIAGHRIFRDSEHGGEEGNAASQAFTFQAEVASLS